MTKFCKILKNRIFEEVRIQKYFKLSLFFYIDKNFEKWFTVSFFLNSNVYLFYVNIITV